MTGTNLEKEIHDFLESNGYDVVEIRTEKRSRLDILKVFLDKDDGITVKDCQNAAHLINDFIDENQLIEQDYRLEVSSPGVDRPLTSVKDFQRKLNTDIQVTYREDQKDITVKGKLVRVTDDDILMIKNKSESFEIPFVQITKGKVLLPW